MTKFILIIIAIFIVGYLLLEFVIPFLLMLFSGLFQLLSWAVNALFVVGVIAGGVGLLRQTWLYYHQRKLEQENFIQQTAIEEKRDLVSDLKKALLGYLDTFKEHVGVQKATLVMTEGQAFVSKEAYEDAALVYYQEKESQINERLQRFDGIFQRNLAEQSQILDEMKQVTLNQLTEWDHRLKDLKKQQIQVLSDDFEEKYTPKQWVIWQENPLLKKIYNKTPNRSVVPWGADEQGDIRYEYVNKRNNVFVLSEKNKQKVEQGIANYLTDLLTVFRSHTKRLSMTIIGDDEAGLAQKVFEQFKPLEDPTIRYAKKPITHFYEERKSDWEQDFTQSLRQQYESDQYLLNDTDHTFFYGAMPTYEIVVFFFDQYTTNEDLKVLDDMNINNRFLPVVFYQARHAKELQKLERYESVMIEVKDFSIYERLRKVETNE